VYTLYINLVQSKELPEQWKEFGVVPVTRKLMQDCSNLGIFGAIEVVLAAAVLS
jgi:hypothetical protein